MEASNMKAMREAWAKVAKCMDEILVRTELDSVIHRKALEAQNLADGALMEPPRNCDVGTAEEQSDRYEAYCDVYHKTTGRCDDCPIYKEECKMTGNIPHCQLVWAQMPYEEGKEKTE